MNKVVLAIGLAIVSLGVSAKTFTLKSSVSGVDFNWADGNNYEGEPYPGPQSGDTIVVPAGVVAIVNAAAAPANGVCAACEIHIEAGGIVETWCGDKTNLANSYFGKLTGTGTIRNSWKNRQDFYICQSCEFGGKIVGQKFEGTNGQIDFVMSSGVTFAMLDPDQTFPNGSPIFRGTSTLKVYRFFPETPSVSGASSLGAGGNFNWGNNSTIQYIGEPGLKETCSRSYWYGQYITYDAGAYGGLTMSGYSVPRANQRVYTLTGSNAVDCTFVGNIDKRTTYPGYAYIRKEGSGTWLLKTSSSNSGGGVVDVHEGTLKIDTLAEKGTLCSLGLSTQLFKYGLNVATSDAVDYAVILGGGSYPAVLEYVGLTAAECTTRPLIVTNAGTIASSQYSLKFGDISAAGVGMHTLTLAGDGDVVNTATNVANGTRGGELSIVKAGASTWNLVASGDLTGTLKVNGGKLSISTPAAGSEDENYFKFSSVSVANGGILEATGGEYAIDEIQIDASASEGSFVNVKFETKGTLDIVNYTAGTTVLPIQVGNLATRENLLGWTVLINGKASQRPMRINADGNLEFVAEGFKIIYRQ